MPTPVESVRSAKEIAPSVADCGSSWPEMVHVMAVVGRLVPPSVPPSASVMVPPTLTSAVGAKAQVPLLA